MKKLKYISFVLLLMLCKSMMAQNCSDKIVIASGGSADSKGMITVGESVVYNQPGGQLQLGYQSVTPYSNCGSAIVDDVPTIGAPHVEMRLFPNPASNQVQIINMNDGTAYYYRLFDYTGKLVMENNLKAPSQTIDISNLTSSIYTLLVTDASGNEKQTFKFIKTY